MFRPTVSRDRSHWNKLIGVEELKSQHRVTVTNTHSYEQQQNGWNRRRCWPLHLIVPWPGERIEQTPLDALDELRQRLAGMQENVLFVPERYRTSNARAAHHIPYFRGLFMYTGYGEEGYTPKRRVGRDSQKFNVMLIITFVVSFCRNAIMICRKL